MEYREPFRSHHDDARDDDDERRREFDHGAREGWRYRDEGRGYAGGRREAWHGQGERGFLDRATDEVRSWFGDMDAERRRREDIRTMYGRERDAAGEGPWHEERPDTGRVERVEAERRWTGGERAVPRGPYTGRGPRGYQRADERIREDVCERLREHGALDASDMEVSVAGGEVTLRGSVSSRWAKREAEDVADTVTGVQDVHNELRVRREGPEASPPRDGQPRGRAA
jgi:osmotically-inducible protein OsmY